MLAYNGSIMKAARMGGKGLKRAHYFSGERFYITRMVDIPRTIKEYSIKLETLLSDNVYSIMRVILLLLLLITIIIIRTYKYACIAKF